MITPHPAGGEVNQRIFTRQLTSAILVGFLHNSTVRVRLAFIRLCGILQHFVPKWMRTGHND